MNRCRKIEENNKRQRKGLERASVVAGWDIWLAVQVMIG